MMFQWFILLIIHLLIQIESNNSIAYFSNRRNITSFNIQNTNDTYYENNIFGLSINKPDGWYSMTSEEIRWAFEDSIIENMPYHNSSVDPWIKKCQSIGSWNDTYAKGEVVRVDDMDVYTVGSDTNSLKDLSIIVFYDIFGFNISQTRVFCDRLAAEYEVQVVMPDFYRGKSASVTTPHLIAWVAQVGNWSQVSIDLINIASWLRNTSSPSRRIAVIGFCWGGLQVARACSNLSNLFFTGISIHGAWLTEEEVNNLQQPVFFIAAGDDPPLQPNISTVIEQSTSSRVSSQCQYETYSNMTHGFVSMGANYSDPYNVEAINKVHTSVKMFLDKMSRNSSSIMSYSREIFFFFFLFLLFIDNIKPY
ncbi:unnamed protein product [Adineta steineri]|uniref:Carboxymethylenebutenolidase homolog n=1 Tax=Adineta steineri TaxID=433720 RepID=A0A815NHC5_9BILA|nr:unnamed protein product [Adineta steineri]CAF3912023.1 unnamed protein product [Adineta steineri]